MENRILYIEDMKKCYELTKEVLGNDVNIRWVKKITYEFDKIISHLETYDSVIVDANLNDSIPETEEGIDIIRKLRETSSDIEIICISIVDKRKKALDAGANYFMFKRQFWENNGRP